MSSPPAKKSAAAKDGSKARSAASPRSAGTTAGRGAQKSAADKAGGKSAAKASAAKEGVRKSAAAKEGVKAASSKAASSKSAAAKSSAAKSAPKKKRSRKKKTSGKIKALTAAFAAGLLAATLAFCFWRGLPLPELSFLPAFSQEQSGVSAAPTPRETAKAPAAQKERAAPQKAPAREKSRAANDGQALQGGRDGQKGGAAAPAGPSGAEAEEARVSSAVASALIDLQSLPYEESLHASLDERIRQVDYALMQAAWMRGLPARALRLAALEDRLEGVEPYQFQCIEILPGSDARAFAAALKDCLAAWAEGATLSAKGGNLFFVSLGGVQTHSIRLYPGKTDFPPLPGQSGPGGVQRGGADRPGDGGAGGQKTAKGKAESVAPVPGGGSVAAQGRSPSPGQAARPLPNLAPPRVRAGHEAPRLVIVIDDLGASPSALQQLLALDFPVTMAFWPHGAHSKEGALAAHAKGREIIVHQPMEPLGYPKMRPGPNVLLTGMNEARIRKALSEGIAAVPHAVGLNNHMGSRFTQSREGVSAVIRLLKERGLFMLDSLTDSRSVFADQGRRMGIKHYRRNVFLDVEHSREAVLAALKRAERIALLSGQAVAIGHPLPETLAGLKAWQKMRNKEVRIVRLQDLAQE